MGFRIFMLIVVLLIPFTMLFFGWLLFRRTPKEINYVFGYRTKRSMRNEETWKFANQYFGKLWYLCGLLSAPLSVIAMAIVFEKGTETVEKLIYFYACLTYYIQQESKKGGDCMTDSQKILELAKQNNAVLTTAMVVHAGFSRGSLQHLVKKGDLERSGRGVYILPEAWDDEFVNLQTRYKRGIYALETALFLCDLADRTPLKFQMFFPATYNLSNPKKDGILAKGAKEPFYSLGFTELTSPAGNPVKAYSAERTLCDILKTRNHVDVQVVVEAFKRYVLRKDKNIPLLSNYAGALHVEEKLRPYLEVLL